MQRGRPAAARAALLLGLLGSALAGCGDETCGPGDAPAAGVEVVTTDGAIVYGAFTSSPNNDCTPPGAAVTSLTVDGFQQGVEPPVPTLTLCIPRPDRIGGGPLALGLTDTDPVRLVDVNAVQAGCSLALDRSDTPSATATLSGVCGNGADPAGFALALAGALNLRRSCGDAVDTVIVELRGRAAVTAL
jgi:hypothetical protein